MINITDKSKCCGCSACVNICPVKCISFNDDECGFKYPKVDIERCIHCNLCEKVCPFIHSESDLSPLNVLCAKNENIQIRKESSSGGVFTLIADQIFKRGGFVVGCAMSDKLDAEHIIVSTQKELQALRSSKYVQSRLDDIFIKIKQLLDDNKYVLFSGTPCQVAGLKRFLRKDYINLITVDLLCHGVPSPKVLKEYLKYQENKFDSKPVYINFRDKTRGWKRLHVEIKFENGKRYYAFSGDDPYLALFLQNKSQRPACFHCPFTTTNRQGDISLGDFWGIGRVFPERDDDKGLSLIIINSEKGKNITDSFLSDMVYFESNIEQAKAGNKVLSTPIKGEKESLMFYTAFVNEGFETAFSKFIKIPSKIKILYYRIARIGLDIMRKILKKGY